MNLIFLIGYGIGNEIAGARHPYPCARTMSESNGAILQIIGGHRGVHPRRPGDLQPSCHALYSHIARNSNHITAAHTGHRQFKARFDDAAIGSELKRDGSTVGNNIQIARAVIGANRRAGRSRTLINIQIVITAFRIVGSLQVQETIRSRCIHNQNTRAVAGVVTRSAGVVDGPRAHRHRLCA